LEDVVAHYLGDVDVVLVEGYKELPLPKIEVVREGQELQCSGDELLAVAGDARPGLHVPCFRPDDAAGLVGLLEGTVFARGR